MSDRDHLGTVCACVRVCVRVCVRACVRVCACMRTWVIAFSDRTLSKQNTFSFLCTCHDVRPCMKKYRAAIQKASVNTITTTASGKIFSLFLN